MQSHFGSKSICQKLTCKKIKSSIINAHILFNLWDFHLKERKEVTKSQSYPLGHASNITTVNSRNCSALLWNVWNVKFLHFANSYWQPFSEHCTSLILVCITIPPKLHKVILNIAPLLTSSTLVSPGFTPDLSSAFQGITARSAEKEKVSEIPWLITSPNPQNHKSSAVQEL